MPTRPHCPVLMEALEQRLLLSNLPPVISVASLTPTNITSLGATQTYTLVASDPDGSISAVLWEFGDGQRAFDYSNTRIITTTGTHAAVVSVTDDLGAVTRQTIVWSASSAGKPNLTVTGGSPANEQIVTSATYNIAGTASGTGVKVTVSSDRGKAVTATGTSNWSASIALAPGLNRLIVQAVETDGDITTVDRLVRYVPAGSIAVQNVTESAASVERWDALEITFNVANSAATYPQWPYNPAPIGVMDQLDGITVNGVFWLAGNPGVTYVRPAFLYQDYQYVEKTYDWIVPTGSPVWKLRFSPPEEGQWQYRIEVAEAKGTAQSSVRSFLANPPGPDNHGPIGPSTTDPRYFEYADGTVYLGQGFNLEQFNDKEPLTYALDMLEQMGTGNEQLIRLWLGGDMWGTGWNAWLSPKLGSGNPPPTSMTTEHGYSEASGSIVLGLGNGWNNTIVNQGWVSEVPAFKKNKQYQIRIRWMTEDSSAGPVDPTKPYGATVKFTGWPVDGQTGELKTLTYSALIPHEHGNTPWHVSQATFTATSDFAPGGFLNLLMENSTEGLFVYIDQVEIYELDASGNPTGSQTLRGSQINSIQYYDPVRAWEYDQIMQQAVDNGVAFKLNISEKNDYLLRRLTVGGLPVVDKIGDHIFFSQVGTAVHVYHEAYWRYMFARYGAYRSVFAWELCNEADPSSGAGYRLGNELAVAAGLDGNPHMGSSSFWSINSANNRNNWTNLYKNPAFADHGLVDFHSYAPGWITTVSAGDMAAYYDAYSRDMLARGFGKPVVWGEFGIKPFMGEEALMSGESELVMQDTQGVWLHTYIWAHTGPGGVYSMYWWEDNAFDYDLHHIFGEWNNFMAGIPLSNGHYVDVAATASIAELKVYGQKDLTNDNAHLYIQNTAYTWLNVINGTPITPRTGTVTVTMAKANTKYLVRWYNTSTGQVSSTQAITSNGSKRVVLDVTNLGADIAAKIDLPSKGDVNVDGKVNDADLTVLKANWLMTGRTWSQGDFTGDGVVNAMDYNYMMMNWNQDLTAPVGASQEEQAAASQPAGETSTVITTALDPAVQVAQAGLADPASQVELPVPAPEVAEIEPVLLSGRPTLRLRASLRPGIESGERQANPAWPVSAGRRRLGESLRELDLSEDLLARVRPTLIDPIAHQ